MLTTTWPTRQEPKSDKQQDAWVVVPDELQVGDVLVSTTESIISTGIRLATRTEVSHAAIHVGGGFIIEAVDAGVRRIHVRSLVYPEEDFVHVLRPSRASVVQCNIASEHARSLVYRPYSVRGAIGSVAPFCRAPDDPGRFCSQVVAEAFARALIPMTRKASERVTPADILQSRALERVPAAKRRVNKQFALHALHELQPQWIHRNPNSRQEPIPAERFEAEVLFRAERVMHKYKCFRKPFHFFDVLRQISEVGAEHFDAAKAVDDVVAEAIREFDAAVGGGVMPRSTIPGLIERPPSPHLPLLLEASSEDEAEEVRRLHREVVAGREWDMREWEATTADFEVRQMESPLASIAGTHFWLLGDMGLVELTYRWLTMEN